MSKAAINLPIKTKILWQNSNPSADFGEQTVTLTNSGKDYNVYKIIYKLNVNYNFLNSVEFIKGGQCFMETTDIVNRQALCSRVIKASSDTSVGFENCRRNDASNINTALIPLYIIGINYSCF